MITAKRLVSLLNSSILGNHFQLKRKEIGDFIDKYSTRANLSADDKIIETDNRNDVLEPKSVSRAEVCHRFSESDVSVRVKYNYSE